jgi:peroxiredoxin
MLSDESGEARKAYSVGRGLMGLSEGRVTFFIDSQGVVRYVLRSNPCLLGKNPDLHGAVRFSIRLLITMDISKP